MILGRVFRSWSNRQPTKEIKVSQPSQIITTTRQNNQILPNELSGRILDLEMQCEGENISKEKVYELIALYTKAVEFYQEQGNIKYKAYQKRMQNFLNRPMIECLLKGQSGQMIIKRQKNDQIVRKAQNQAQKQIKQLLQKQQQKQKKQTQIIKQLLTKQDNHLQQRIKRKRTMSNRSFNSKNSDATRDNFDIPLNNQESNKKVKQMLNRKLSICGGIQQRNNGTKRIFFQI